MAVNYVDNRNWKEVNAQLVRRGKFYLHLECVEDWHNELGQMNQKKSGAPYKYPETFILFASVIYSFFRMPYRQLERFIDRLGTYIPGLIAADYTTLHKRISKLALQIPIPDEDVIIAVDSTGMKVTNRGEWTREKHGKVRRGWLNVHVAFGVEFKKLLSIEVTEEKIADSKVLKPLLKNINIKEGLMDGGYDTNDAFDFMLEKGVDCPGIRIRENAVVGEEPSPRSNSVLEYKKMGYKGWRQMHQYGRRWAVEGLFSAVKRIFGVAVRTSSICGMISEIKRIFTPHKYNNQCLNKINILTRVLSTGYHNAVMRHSNWN